MYKEYKFTKDGNFAFPNNGQWTFNYCGPKRDRKEKKGLGYSVFGKDTA